MATYRFTDHFMIPVLQHIESYKLKVLQLQPDGSNYILTTDGPVPVEEYDHLNVNYEFSEVV